MKLKDNGDGIGKGSCRCPRGKGKCHHMAALLLHAHHNISVTDQECVWSKKEAKKKTAVRTVSELFPPKVYKAVDISNRDDLKREFYKTLENKNKAIGFSWLLSQEPITAKDTSIPSMEDVLFSKEFENSENKEKFLEDYCSLTSDDIRNVSSETIGQASNWKWAKLRKFRLTASNFGIILKAMERHKFNDSFYKTICGLYNLDGVKAVQWGKQMEATAAAAFEKITKLTTSDTGLWVHPSGLFGASPDKLVHFVDGTTGTLEIKCPFKHRNSALSDVLKKDKKYIVTVNEGNNYVINKEHNYYHQIQGQLHIVDCKKAFLVLWTLKETLVFQIERDDSWVQNFNTLKKFYFEHFISHILKNT